MRWRKQLDLFEQTTSANVGSYPRGHGLVLIDTPRGKPRLKFMKKLREAVRLLRELCQRLDR